MRHVFLLAFATASIFLIGCKKQDTSASRPDLSSRSAKILATTGMIADAVRNIGGEFVQVECLMGPGIDPHRYVPTPNDLSKINQADLVIYNGLHLEGKMSDIFESRSKTARVVAIGEGLPNLRQAEEGYEGTHDPHIWFDVKMWIKAVERVREALIELDPDRKAIYLTNAESYQRQLESLESEIRDKIEKLPKERRVLITAHDAFGYFGRAYGFEVRGLQGVSTAGETSGKDVEELANLIGTRKIKALFAETSVSEKGMLAVQRAVHSKYKGFEVHLAKAQLYSDALGETGSSGETYIGMVRHNVNAIVSELGD